MGKIHLTYAYKMEGHFPTGPYILDLDFYRSLPDVKEIYKSSVTGRLEIPRPDVVQLLTIIGTTALSSTVLAKAIKAWLENRQTKITVVASNTERKVTFEGPNLKKSLKEIKELLELLTVESNTGELHIRAEQVEESEKNKI